MTETELVMQGIEAETWTNSLSKTESSLLKTENSPSKTKVTCRRKKFFVKISALTIPCDPPLKFFHMSFGKITETDTKYQPQYGLNTESRNAEMPQNISRKVGRNFVDNRHNEID